MYTDHTLPSDSIMSVDAYDRRLDTYFVREGMNRKNKKADLEKIIHKVYILDWSQSKVFLVLLCYFWQEQLFLSRCIVCDLCL